MRLTIGCPNFGGFKIFYDHFLGLCADATGLPVKKHDAGDNISNVTKILQYSTKDALEHGLANVKLAFQEYTSYFPVCPFPLAQNFRDALSTAGNSMTSSERHSPKSLLKKRLPRPH